jgi:tyrosinase
VGFYFHHAMIDLVYSTWQALDFPHRQQVISGGTLMFSPDNSTRATLNDTVDLEVVGKPYMIKELVSTVEGPFCYLYQ